MRSVKVLMSFLGILNRMNGMNGIHTSYLVQQLYCGDKASSR